MEKLQERGREMKKSLKALIGAFVTSGVIFMAAPSAIAQQTYSCSDINFTGRVLSNFPDANRFCKEVVEKDGEMYAHFTAEFVRRSGNQVELRFKNDSGGYHDETLWVDVPDGQRVKINGRNLYVRQLERGDELDIYLPSDRWEVAQYDTHEEFAAAPAVATYEIVDEPDDAGSSYLPSTASPLPLIGLLGGLFTSLGAGLAWLRIRRARQ
jgi:hypothetical protein